MTVNLNIVEKCVSCLNIKESYDLARRMEQEKTNPVLGYRTAGSLAERKTGDMLLEEMNLVHDGGTVQTAELHVTMS